MSAYAVLRTRLNQYFLLSYLLILLTCVGFLRLAEISAPRSAGFALAVWFSYAALYLLPAWALARLSLAASRGRWPALIWTLAVLGSGLTQILLVTDYTVFTMFSFHLNGFVWNLLTTPGGIESMGGGADTELSVAALMTGLLLLQSGLLALLLKWRVLARLLDGLNTPRLRRSLIAALVVLGIGERLSYGISHIQAYTPVLDSAHAFPFYTPTTFTSLARKWGYEPKRGTELKLKEGEGLNYPARPMKFEATAKPLNIVWLVAESLRGDMLNPEIMPNLWAFSQQGLRYTQHHSGGNGTRMGLFTMFYGLYGNYWFPMLQARRAPVLMDRIQQLDYQTVLQTSSKFSYPEFDRTLFANVPKDQLHEVVEGQYWQRDRANVARMLDKLDARDPAKPFFAFQFFESPHARYYFPDETVIRKDYLEEMNYATMDIKKDIGLIKNRYINAVHHLDQQLGRVFAYLRDKQLLDSTLVVITGDHGEEFMENGHWGHNSQFTHEQTHVPLVLAVPGQAPAVVERLSSHLDLPATLLPLLGANNPAEDYSQGQSLLNGPERQFTVFADWNRIAYMDDQFKLVFPLKSSGYTKAPVTTPDDQPVANGEAVLAGYQDEMLGVLKDLSRFRRKP